MQEFIQEIKKNEVEFAKHLAEELPEGDQLTGQSDQEKMNKFLTDKEAEAVIKTFFGYKLKNKALRVKIKTERENELNEEEQPLDEEIYPQKDGEYTSEAMTRYLFEKKTGQSHLFSTSEE